MYNETQTDNESVRSLDGTLIACSAVGSPDSPVVIRIDGAATYRALDPGRQEFTQRLSSNFRVISYDRRGRGDSQDAHHYAVEREIEDVAALLSHFGGAGYVVGLSSGAVLALHCAQAGLPITGMLCYEPPFVLSQDRKPVPVDYVDQLQSRISAGNPGEAVKLFMTEAVGMPAAVVDAMSEQPFWPVLEALGHTLVCDALIMGDTMRGNPAAINTFTTIEAPTMVLAGEKSEPWLRQSAQHLAARLPRGTSALLQDQTHDVDPAALADAVGAYFTSVHTKTRNTS